MKRTYPVVDTVKTGQNIKMIMLARGLTVRDIQEFLGLCAPQGIYHWFDGRSMPTLDNLYALSELFRLPVDALLIGNRKYLCKMYMDPMSRRLYAYYERLLEMAG